MRVDGLGYWGHPTASVDWCEANYAHSHYVCEWFNTLSSLVIAGVALGGLMLHRRVLEVRFLVAFAALAVVGLGSTAFHATLLFELQMADELPMLYLALVMVFILSDLRPDGGRKAWLGPVLVAHGVLVTALCTLTRGPVQFYTFHVSFGSLELYCLYRTFRIFRETRSAAVRTLFRWGMSFYLLALVMWFTDLRFCSALSEGLAAVGVANPQLHAVWHILVSLGFYALILQIAHERLEHLGRRPELVSSGFRLATLTAPQASP